MYKCFVAWMLACFGVARTCPSMYKCFLTQTSVTENYGQRGP